MAVPVAFCPLFQAQAVILPTGVVNSGGLINTYLAGTSTPAATYTDSGGTVLNTNPIQLGPDGWAPSEIWLPVGVAYKFVVTDSLGGNAKTYDNVIAMQAGYTFTNQNVTATSDVGGFIAQLITNAGYVGFRVFDQAATRKLEHIYWGSASTPAYGMTAGSAGVNTSANVPYSIGTADTVRMLFSGTSADIIAQGVGVTRTKVNATSVASNTTLANDPDLVYSAVPVGRYEFTILIPIYATTGGAGGFKWATAFTGTLTNSFVAATGAINGAAYTALATVANGTAVTHAAIVAGTGAAPADWLLITGGFTVSVAGNFAFQWAQNASNANAANVGAGASMKVYKVG